MPTTVIPQVRLELDAAAALRNPTTVFRRVLAAGPVLHDPDLDRYVVGHYADVRHVAGNAADFAQDAEFHARMTGARDLLGLDNPEHSGIRSVFNPSFTHTGLRELEKRITALVAESLDTTLARIAADGAADAIDTLARPVSSRTIAAILDVPSAVIPEFLDWSTEMSKATEALVEPDPARREALATRARAGSAAMLEFAGRHLAGRREGGRDEEANDLVSRYARDDVIARLPETEQRANLARLVIGGHDNTSKMLAHMLVVLARHPEQRAAIAADPSLVPQAVDELLRYVTSAPAIPKVARHDVPLGDHVLPAGARVFAMLGAANHDPDRWTDPDRFDIFRPRTPHLSFGFGTHACIGASVTRLELRAAMTQVLARMPEYRLVDEDLEYGPLFLSWGPLQVRLAA
jgi:cytochrome P450